MLTFTGLILKANKRYTQTVSQAFHVSTAALDTAQVKGNEDIQVLLTSDNNTFLLCTLNKERIPQCPLDLNFAEGDKISFSIKGEGLVHLTGFLIPDADDFMNDLGDEEEEETNDTANSKPAKGKKQQPKPQELANNKKQAKKVEQEADSDDDDDDEEENPFNLEDAEADSDAEEGESDDEGAGEEADSDDDDDDDDDGTEEGAEEEASGDDDDDDSDDDEDVPQQPKKKAKLDEKVKQNGLENGQASTKEKKKEKQQQGGATKSLPGGVQVTELKVGAGPEAKPGKKVAVYYEGRLKTNNKIFDSSKSGSGFKFSLGRGEVIKGWDIGVSGMKVGGKRRIVCPPNVAYGPKGSPPVIPPNSTLVFDVELKNVH